ncbi:MAG: insulinase family protein [Gammaproteobacteria bacterium]|nr:insulinase family protein [Gammaproteobacteria bacterium]
MSIQKLLSTLLLAAVPLSLSAATAVAELTHEYTLDNGLKLIVREDHRAPVVVSQIWYRVGSSDESGGITGISHVLEHMMFKGTKRHGPGEFSRIISRNGGRENAFTGTDYTAYFQQLEQGRLAISFELEADRMRNLLLDKDEFAKELQVVKEERRMRTEDDPQGLTDEQFRAAAFVNNPYHNPIIGWMDDLDHLTVDDLQQWYQRWYAPNNAILVVVGDVKPAAVYTLAKKHFGGIKPAAALTATKPRREIAQPGVRRITVKAPAELPYLMMGYKVPTLASQTAESASEPYALEVLAGILDGNDSARFAKELRRGKQIAAEVSAGYDTIARYDSLLLLDGTPAQGQTIAALEQALRAQIKALRSELVSVDELARIKAQVIADKVYERDSVFYQAMQIGSLESVGLSWRVLDSYLSNIEAVTPQQVMDVARKYLGDDQLTIAELQPLPPAEGAATHGAGHIGGQHVR